MITEHIIQSLVFAGLDGISGSRCCSYLRRSIQHQLASPESRQRNQQGKLLKLSQAAANTRLYANRIEENGISLEQLATVKPVTKSELRLHFPSGVYASTPRSDWRYLTTSGTTERLSVVSDFQKRDYRRACELHALIISHGACIAVETLEIPPNACNVVCGTQEQTPSGFVQFFKQSLRNRTLFKQQSIINLRGLVERKWIFRKSTLPPIEPGPEAALIKTLDDHLAIIAKSRPRLLRAYPPYLMWLADRARQQKMQFPSLHFILPYGGLASPKMIHRIEKGFRCRFRNVYGTSELGIIAASCGHDSGMHVLDDLFLTQISPIAPQDVRGSLLVTDLANLVMPLICYEVGDIGSLKLEECSCGRKSPRLTIYGRQQECVMLENQLISSSEVADCLFEDEAISNGRVDEVAPGCFEALIVATPGIIGRPDLHAWESRFRNLTGLKIKRLRSRLVPYLEPETSGKYLLIRPLASQVRLRG